MLQRVMSRFCVETFLWNGAEKFHSVTLVCCVSENFWQRKRLWIRRGDEYQDFPSKFFFVSLCRKLSQGNPSVLCLRKFPVAKKIKDKRGGVSRFSVESFFVSECRNIS